MADPGEVGGWVLQGSGGPKGEGGEGVLCCVCVFDGFGKIYVSLLHVFSFHYHFELNNLLQKTKVIFLVEFHVPI